MRRSEFTAARGYASGGFLARSIATAKARSFGAESAPRHSVPAELNSFAESRRRSRAFTLIELLVVIAIIAILAAILFPVFLSAKRKALIGTCQAHQKSLCAALTMYTDDYGGWLPRIQFLSTGGGQLLCDRYVRNRQILACSAMMVDPDDNTYGLPKSRNMGFACNQHCLCDTVLTKSGVRSTDVWVTVRGYGEWTGRPLGSIRRTSRTPAFFCAESVHTVSSAYGTVYIGFGWEPADARNRGRMWNAHDGGSNYCFLDGHVKWLLPGGNGFYQAIAGIDYDGNGTEGDSSILR